MYEIKKIEDASVVREFFFNDPKLCLKALSDEMLHQIKEDIFRIHSKSTFLGFYIKDELYLLFKYEMFTPVCINIHAYLHSYYHGTELINVIKEKLMEWGRENLPNVTKIISMCPRSCTHASSSLEDLGFKKEAELAEILPWRGISEDLLIYSTELR